MDSTSWAQVIAPVILSTIISIIITAINNKITKRKMARKVLLGRRISKLIDFVFNIKSKIINIKCQVNDFSEELEKFYMCSGDLQVYVEDNRDAMMSEVGKNTAIYCLDKIDTILNSVTDCGNCMKKNDADGFANAMNEVQDICEELIKKYNISLSKIEYM